MGEMSLFERSARLGICAALGLILWFWPVPAGVEPDGWRVLAVFAATILGLLLRPFAMSTVVLFGLLVLVVTQTIGEDSRSSLEAALVGFSNTTVWLVVAAFLIAGSVIRTGLGRRIALTLVNRLGQNERGLAYGIGFAELLLAPVIPSNTARGGGIVAPVVDAVSKSVGEGRDSDEARAVGRYLVFAGAHFNLITAAMFLTAMAANPLVAEAAGDVAGIDFTWGTWALGAIVPGLVAIALLPVFLHLVIKPPRIDGAAARTTAQEQLTAMGPRKREETILISVLIGLVALWATGPLHGLHVTVVALLGIAVLLATGAERWRDLAATWGAWDALIWLGGLLTMANLLRDTGVISWFASAAATVFDGYAGMTVAIGLALIYFYSMYGFSMLTGHISAMVGAFLVIAVAADAPPLLMVAMLAYFSNLCGCLTHYSTGPVVIYFGLGYHTVPDWFRVGFFVSLFHMVVWLGVGLPWWKFLGWW